MRCAELTPKSITAARADDNAHLQIMSSSLTSSSLTSSLLGEQHLQRCQSMTWRAAVATMTALVVLSLACSPLLLALPVVLCVYIASEAVFVVIYW